MMDRDRNLRRVAERTRPWDLAVIGGGATGVAVALDAAARGLDVVLCEQSDFGKGTSSRSTKLVHGGVRYLRSGEVSLVRTALRERTRLHQNAPHLVHDLPFLVPCESWFKKIYFGIGFKMYDLLAGASGFGRSQSINQSACLARIPTIRKDRVRYGLIYHDGQFDDSRLLINMAQTAAEQGGCLLNYAPVTELKKDDAGAVNGVRFTDSESGQQQQVSARCVVNATGAFCDAVRKLDAADSTDLIAPSQGVHIVLPQSFLPGETALIVPETSDGRVLFAIPWHDAVVVGTTDTPIDHATLEPRALPAEIDFLLATTADYLSRAPTRSDVLSVFTGIRPLVKEAGEANTASLSRDHTILFSDSGLLTITGGKWTTVRQMAEECVDKALSHMGLPSRECRTEELRLHGYLATVPDNPYAYYGADAQQLDELAAEKPGLADQLHRDLPIRGIDVVWSVRKEMARTLDDVLSRRTRSLFLNVSASETIAPAVAQLMAAELGRDAGWAENQVTEFQQIADHYKLP